MLMKERQVKLQTQKTSTKRLLIVAKYVAKTENEIFLARTRHC